MSAGRNCRRKPAVSRDRFFDSRLAKLKGHYFRPFDAGSSDGNELPGIAVREQGELEQAPGKGAGFAAVFSNLPGRARYCAAGADHERADALFRIQMAVGVERCKAFVIVIVTGRHDAGAGFMEPAEHHRHFRIVAMQAKADVPTI